MSYTSQSTPSSYNQSPPADDGTETEANKINWSKIKTKLSDPLNTFATNINNAIVSAFNAIDKLTTEGDTLYRNGSGYARLPIGTAKQVWTVNSGATAPEWATPIFSESFTSSDQTITADSALDVAHGLSSKPKLVQISLKCTTANQGWAVGDEILTGGSLNTQGTDDGFHSTADATNVTIITGTSLLVLGKSSFDDQGLTLTSWRYVVRAWA